ncbi:MAG: terminase small subunit [Clostridia bacterium]|nr:terminase small subunit [Clostridia bacterium]
MSELRRKEARFVSELEQLSCEQAAEAVVRAGLAPAGKRAERMAERLLMSEEVTEYIRSRAEMKLRACGYTQERICLELIRIYERCMQIEPVTKKGEEGLAGEYKFDSRGAMKALELLGQCLGFFKRDVKLTADEISRVEIEVIDQ